MYIAIIRSSLARKPRSSRTGLLKGIVGVVLGLVAMPYFKVWCPCPEKVERSSVGGATVCSKGTALLAKGTDRDQLLDRVRNHLVCSPYHLLTEDQADVQMQVTEDYMEEWGTDDEAPKFPAIRAGHRRDEPSPSRERRSLRSPSPGRSSRHAREGHYDRDPAQERPRLRSPVRRPAAGSGRSSGASGRSRSRQQRRSPEGDRRAADMSLQMVASSASSRSLPTAGTVEIRSTEFQMICDSIRRAAANVRNAEQLCERAAQAFRLEAAALESAHAALMMSLVHR